jgi:putative tryptophan/tyrosine transport system substrate-binding protein
MTARPSVGPMLATFFALILTVLSIALPAGAEHSATIPTIGWLVFESAEGGLDGFRQGLRELGYVEGRTIAIEARPPAGTADRLVEQLKELARLKVKIIVTGGVPATLAAKRPGLLIPVVFIMADPVGSGVVSSLARPGGNMTGQFLAIEEQFSGKWLQLLKEAAPQVSRIAYLWNPANHSSISSWKAMQALAPTLGLTLQSVEARDLKDIDQAFSDHSGPRRRAHHRFGSRQRRQSGIDCRVRRRKPPAGYLRLEEVCRFRWPDVVRASFYGLWRHAATYVDRILKGATPADLPVEQPTTFEFVVNLKTAKSVGLTIPHSILLRADEVIE